TRAFQISTLVVVLAMAALVVIPSLVSEETKTYRVGLAGQVAAGTGEALAVQAKAADKRVRTTTYETVAAGQKAVRDRKADVLLVDGTTLEWRRQSDATLATLVGNAVQALRIRDRAAQLGLSMRDVGGLLAPVALSSRRLGSASGLGENAQDVALIAMVLLFTAVITYGNMVLTGVVQEKQSRVAEVLLARMRPRELMAGKVIGIGALGLAQFALVIATAAVSLAAVDAADTPHVPTSVWVWLVVWFVLGYAFFSVVYAALGALASRVEDASSAAAPVSVVLGACYLAGFAAIESPESTLTTVLSFVPATAPIIMPVRLTLTTVPAWEVAAAALLTAAAVWLLVRFAGRVYTGAVLRTGVRIPLHVAWRGGAQRA
ncbi:MAG TPA: ABC transporter permease, partial [Candidatus Eisenbacteria bacterium]|nr:ABC transporter permease [Candidatus Eisenbacteria bacterium]